MYRLFERRYAYERMVYMKTVTYSLSLSSGLAPLCPLVKKKLKNFKITLDKLIHMCYNTNCNVENAITDRSIT